VRCDGSKVDDLDVTDRVDDFGDLRGGDLAHDAPLGVANDAKDHSIGWIWAVLRAVVFERAYNGL
jgi:hypothetical protein